MNINAQLLKIVKEKRVSLSAILTGLVGCIVLTACIIGVSVFTYVYMNSTEENAVTSSEQAVSQVARIVTNYVNDMSEIMDMVRDTLEEPEETRNEFLQTLIEMRKDVEAITIYSEEGNLLAYWSNGQRLKERVGRNLSYKKLEEDGVVISAPHVQNLFINYYPWVVTFSQRIETDSGEIIQVFMDIRFSSIAEYVDEVGIGAHGYSYIMDADGNIVYHPQQQLIYAGLKEEQSEDISGYQNGSYTIDGIIYTVHPLENCDWRIVGVSYVDELVTIKMVATIRIVLFIAVIVVLTTVLAGIVLAKTFSKPASELAGAMSRFVKEAEDFEFYPVKGTEEIVALSNSFEHMVVQIQELMEKVRNEEITLRKTELNALQAQINPHFLYNTLDSIAWMCEVGRTEEAVEMVNALARLFRISISKGHELITIRQELQHAECYLKIQKFRYKSQFDYKFKVEDNCLGYLCNKITLQPMIENAIVHGLDLTDKGEIVIEVYEEDKNIVMTVWDNGVGMTEEQCKEIMQKDTHQKGGIGIKNVNDRIKIYFGEQYGITISSELDEWTKVEIRMPKISEESYEL